MASELVFGPYLRYMWLAQRHKMTYGTALTMSDLVVHALTKRLYIAAHAGCPASCYPQLSGIRRHISASRPVTGAFITPNVPNVIHVP